MVNPCGSPVAVQVYGGVPPLTGTTTGLMGTVVMGGPRRDWISGQLAVSGGVTVTVQIGPLEANWPALSLTETL